ncbi:MAG: C40 family peptidase [Parvularcula sp.]
MAEFDPRITPARGDIAARVLKGQVNAKKFVDGELRQVATGVLPIRKNPASNAPQETQGLFGELFTVLDEQDGWAWGQAAYDGYVGYVETSALSAKVFTSTHRVTALRTILFSAQDLKSVPVGIVSMGARLCLGEAEGPYRKDARGGWVWQGHTVACEVEGGDPVRFAEAHLGAPYLWGGRDSIGLDCSALIQNAWGATGAAIPRDADQQERFFSDPSNGDILWPSAGGGSWKNLSFARGDLLYWPGHTGVMVDAETMLHANATHMATTKDPVRAIASQWQSEKGLMMRTIVRPHGASHR